MSLGKEADRFPALMYHHVGPWRPGTNPEMTVSPEDFARQVRWWGSEGYAGITPSDWLACREQAKPLPAKVVLFTFDDAYAELDTYALPTLRKHGFSAAIYCVTRKLGQTNDWDEACGFGGHRLMTSDRIRHWADAGFEFGSHTRTHPDLRTLSDAQLDDEIAGSAQDLARLLGKPPTSFAYPYGHSDERARRAVERHFKMAFSIDEGVNSISTDPYRLLRIGVRPGDWPMDPWWIATFGFSLRHQVRKFAGRMLRGLRLAPERRPEASTEAAETAQREAGR